MTRCIFYQYIAFLGLFSGPIGQWFVHSFHLPSSSRRTIRKSIVARQRDTTTTTPVQRFEPSIGNPSFSDVENRYVKRHPARDVMTLFLSSFPVDPITTSNNNNNNNDEDTNGDNDNNNNTPSLTSKINLLQQENQILRLAIKELENENQALESQRRIPVVIETFEGEGNTIQNPWWNGNGVDSVDGEVLAVGTMAATMVTGIEECDDRSDDGTCPLEPDVSFKDALRDRAYWLVGLLVLQSMSGFILARNELLLQTHPVIIYFLTMLVGAGGNAGNQASVRVIRGLALGNLNDDTQRQFLNREFKMAVSLSVVLSIAGFFRAVIFRTPIAETIAITLALSLIVFSSICLGAILPLLLRKIKVDPAHSSTSIQVIMDILGVVLTVVVSTAILDSPAVKILVSKLSGGG